MIRIFLERTHVKEGKEVTRFSSIDALQKQVNDFLESIKHSYTYSINIENEIINDSGYSFLIIVIDYTRAKNV